MDSAFSNFETFNKVKSPQVTQVSMPTVQNNIIGKIPVDKSDEFIKSENSKKQTKEQKLYIRQLQPELLQLVLLVF